MRPTGESLFVIKVVASVIVCVMVVGLAYAIHAPLNEGIRTADNDPTDIPVTRVVLSLLVSAIINLLFWYFLSVAILSFRAARQWVKARVGKAALGQEK